jgi:opacity protein-like surface antigen
MKRMALLGAAFAALVPNVLLADMNYTNLEVSLLDVEQEAGPNVDGDGFEVAGSYELSERIFLFGEWQDHSLDQGVDGRVIEVGAGLAHDFSDKLDFVASLSFVDAEVKSGNFTADDDGLALGGGIRSRVADSVEIDAGLKYVDFDNAGGDTGLSVGGRYYFKNSMAVGASADFNDNADTLRIGFRWEF